MSKEHTSPPRRRRVQVIGMMLVIIAFGLLSRSGHPIVPHWLAQNAGDALWTTCLYMTIAAVAPQFATRRLLVLAIGISFCVELSQLAEVQWLEEIRRTTAGHLLLGRGWQWADLPRYVAGALIAGVLDQQLLQRS
jgi:hypothetical protein